jgi:hypothetical protein
MVPPDPSWVVTGAEAIVMRHAPLACCLSSAYVFPAESTTPVIVSVPHASTVILEDTVAVAVVVMTRDVADPKSLADPIDVGVPIGIYSQRFAPTYVLPT